MLKNLFSRRKKKSFDLTPEQDDFLAASIQEYNESLKGLNESIGFDQYDEWSYDQYSGVLSLIEHRATKIEADAQIIGSLNGANMSWEWAWNNPNIEESAKVDSITVKEYGEKESIWYFSQGIVPVLHEEQAIYFAAIGKKLTGSQAVFPGDSGTLKVYLLLKNIRSANA